MQRRRGPGSGQVRGHADGCPSRPRCRPGKGGKGTGEHQGPPLPLHQREGGRKTRAALQLQGGNKTQQVSRWRTHRAAKQTGGHKGLAPRWPQPVHPPAAPRLIFDLWPLWKPRDKQRCSWVWGQRCDGEAPSCQPGSGQVRVPHEACDS